MSSRSFLAGGGHRALGVVFLALLLMLVWLTYAIYTKRFVDYVPVTLQTSKIGLQLPQLADVKLRGVIVGEVRDVRVDADGAELELALDPDEAGVIPANVTARIVPKTLFGEKYVELEVPERPAATSISAGDVIGQSRVAIEVEQVLNDLYPLLRTVQPADLNYTLTALATALEGRGEELGENLSTLESYLRRTNPRLPELMQDVRMLADVSDTYRAVMPELARLLRNSVTTGGTFVEQEQQIQALLRDVARFSGTAEDFLDRNGDNLTRAAALGEAQLPVFAKYSPEFPCLLQGQVNWLPRGNEIWRGHGLHINLELLPKQPRGYTPADSPEYDAKNGPTCVALPNPPYDQVNIAPQPREHEIDDGVEAPVGKRRVAPLAGLLMDPITQDGGDPR